MQEHKSWNMYSVSSGFISFVSFRFGHTLRSNQLMGCRRNSSSGTVLIKQLTEPQLLTCPVPTEGYCFHKKWCGINKTNITEVHCKSIAANKQWNSVLIRLIRRESVEKVETRGGGSSPWNCIPLQGQHHDTLTLYSTHFKPNPLWY